MFRTSRSIPVVADVVLAQSVSRSIVADVFLAWSIRCDTRHRCLELAPELVAASLEPNSEDQIHDVQALRLASVPERIEYWKTALRVSQRRICGRSSRS